MTKNFFKRVFGGKANKGFVFTSRHIAALTMNGERIRRTSADSTNSPDSISNFLEAYTVDASLSPIVGTGTTNKVPAKLERKSVKPIDVFSEIKDATTPETSFENLDQKIKVVKERISVLKEHLKEEHLGDEYRTLFYLENRKKYLTTRKKTPLDWATTTQDAVDDLCKRYKLKVVPLKQYYTLVPEEGIKEIDRYTKSYEAITGDKPIFELVIKDEPKETKKKDRDPILLANSPLGNFLFILGAWDDEVAIVDEIIYGGK